MSENPYCGSEPCPVILNSSCVFYQGQNLIYIGVNTNDPLSDVIEKINQAFQNSGIGYAFTNGITQPSPFDPVQLGGSLIQNTTIGGNYNLTFVGELQASKFITTGGTASQFVKGDGSLDNVQYQPIGNYLTALSGDGTATGPGSAVFTLSTVNFAPGTFGNGSNVPVVTVDGKGRVTNLTSTPLVVPPQSLTFIGDVVGSGLTGAAVTLSLQNVNSNVYNTNTALKFAANAKGLVTSATPLTGSDINSILGYIPVPDSRTLTINGVTYNLSQNRSWNIGASINFSTIGDSGPATWNPLSSSLNIPVYSLSGLGGVPLTRTLTINGTAYDLSLNRTWTVGDIRSDQTYNDPSWLTGLAWSKILSTPTTLSGYGITDAYTQTQIANFFSGATVISGYNNINWNTAYDNKINSAAVTGTTTKTLTLTQQDGGTITATWSDLNTDAVTSVFGRTGAILAQSGDYNTSQVTENTNLYFTEPRVLSTLLSGYTVGTNTALAATDNILQAFQKTQGQIDARSNVTLGTANGLSLLGQVLSLGLASGSQNGALSSTDWSTFNAKQNALTNPVTGTGASGQVSFWNGTNSQAGSNNLFWDNVNDRLGIGTITPATTMHIVGNAIRAQSNLSDATPKGFDIVSGHHTNSQSPFLIAATASNATQSILWVGGGSGLYNSSTDIRFFTASNNTTLTGIERGRFTPSGNLLLGTFTDAGFRLDVAGSTRIVPPADTTALTLSGYSLTGSSAVPAIDISGTWNTTGTPTLIRANVTDAASNANSLLMDLQVGGSSLLSVGTNGRATIQRSGGGNGFRFRDTRAANRDGSLGLDGSGTRVEFSMGAGVTFGFAIINSGGWSTLSSTNGTNQNNEIRIGTNGINATGFPSALLIGANFNPTSGISTWTLNQIAPTINQTGGANGITRGLFVNPTLTSAFDWRSIEWSNNTGRGLWGVGTSDNAVAGNLHIGSATVANAVAQLEVTSTTKGFLPPRMTTAQRDLIAAVAGLVIYNSTTNKHQGYNGTNWNDFY